MPTQLQLRRGTTSQNNAFTGAAGEVSVDTTTDNLRVHDGSTAGGFEIISVEPTGKIGFIGNTNPAASTVSFGVPANVVIHALAAQTGNVIIGDPTHTTAHSLDVRGTANVGALTSTGITGDVTGDVTGDLTGAIVTASQGNITTVGALNGGSITSGFGTIDTGSSAITSTGAISGGSFVVADDGTIGSTSDTDAIAISAAGIVALSAATEASATGTAAVTTAGGLGVAKDIWVGDDIVMDSDLAAISLGDNQDVTLTHVHDKGVALNLGLGLAGNTAPIATAISMGTPANVVIRTHAASGAGNVIVGDATATSAFNLDVHGTANVGALTSTGITGTLATAQQGNITSVGILTGIIIADDGNIGSASDDNAIAISAAGVVGLTAATEASATGTAALTVAGGIGVAKDMWIGDDIVMDSDAAVIKMGDAQAVTLTHVADTGVALNLGLGVAGNTAPIATAISMGTPANIVLRTNTHQGNVIIGDATATTSFTFDVRGTANTAILQGTELHQANVTAAAYGKLVPSGVVVPYGSATAPVGWLLCNDDAVSRSVYADLFSAIGTLFGTGDGSTTFNVPSMGDRLPLGKGTNNGTIGGETAGAAASAVVATASGSAALTLTTGTFATSAKDSSTASALTNCTAGGHTHNLTLPVQVFQYIIKT